MASGISSPEFIGRQEELTRLVDAVAAAGARRPSLVLVGGEAGIGKSRLVAEATRRAREDGGLVLEGGAVDLGDTPLPFGPIVEALRGYFRIAGKNVLETGVDHRSREALARLLPEIGPATEAAPLSVLRPEWLQAQLFEAVLALLGRLGERQPVVLVVEDVHWADRSTRELLAFLVRNLHDERLLIIGTFRSDELHRRHPLLPWLAELDRHHNVARLDLDPFDRLEQAAQLRSILGRAPEEALLDAIHTRSDGNPFFAEELLGLTVGSQRAAEHRDGSRRLPASLTDLLLARIGTLSEGTQRLLGVACVAGGRVEHDLLLAVADTDEAEVESALREAVSRHALVVEEMPGPRYGFRHALVREAVYDDLLPSERRRLHAMYAEALAGRPTPPGADGARHLAELAHHWTNAQMQKQALATSIQAANAARATFAFAEAGQLYERAIELWEVVPPVERPAGVDQVELFLQGARAFELGGDYRRAVDFGREAVRRHDADVDPVRAGRIRAQLGLMEFHAGDLDAGIATYEEARVLVADEAASADRAEMLRLFAGILFASARMHEGIAFATEAINTAVAAGARLIEGKAKNTMGATLSVLGDCDTGIALLEEARAIAHETEDPEALASAYATLAAALGFCGQTDRAIAVGREGADVARGLGMWGTLGVYQECNTAFLLYETGRWTDAADALERLEPYATSGFEGIAYRVFVARFKTRRGDADARRYIDDELTALERTSDAQFTADVYQALVEWELYAGRPEAAAAAADEAVRRLSARDDQLRLIMMLTLGLVAEAERAALARAQRDKAAVESARGTAGRYSAQLTEFAASRVAALPHVRPFFAWAAAERQRIEGVADPEAWAAVRAAWTAVDRPYYAAYAGFRQAEAALSARRPRAEAEQPLREAHQIVTRLGARPLLGWIEGLARRARIDLADPGLARPADAVAAAPAAGDPIGAALERYGLTRREREVLGLIAGGWTNRRIAEALFISESTAGVHVSNILGKLGAANRAEAASLAARLGVAPPDEADSAHSVVPRPAR